MKLFRIILSFIVVATTLNACQKEYSVEQGNKQITVGTWEFANGSSKYSGNMDTIFQVSAGGINELFLIGNTKDGTQSFQMHLYADSFKVGTYKASAFQSSFIYTSSAGKTIYLASQLIGEFTVNITAISHGNIEGNFSGSAKDSSGNITQIDNGKFKSTFASGSVNPSSAGVLGDSSGNCKPVTFFGDYAAGIPVNNSNAVQVQVTVTIPGAYTITTNTVNGLSFSKSGTFEVIGPQNVLLTASGTPTTVGNNNFILYYGNSQCAFTVNILGAGTGTLGVGGGNCTSFILAGTYQQGIDFNTGNTVQIQVNAATPGSYHISSDTVNGVSFSGSGILGTVGVHNVLLTGKGTPTNSGLQNFLVTYGSSTCSFPVTFISAVAASDDYFPISLNSNWSYNLINGDPSDSITYTSINYSPTKGGKVYQAFQETISDHSVTDSFYYRKPGGDYYQYANFSNYFGFDQYVGSEFIFLKDNVGVSATWNSPTINGSISGIPISGYIKMTILAKGVPVTSIPQFTFPDVIKVQYEYFINGIPTPILTQQRWFAKNSGEIYFSSDNGATSSEYEVSGYQAF
ncbi:MAG: hypothetical protein ABI237_01710 [Ginsengibacter sp.]